MPDIFTALEEYDAAARKVAELKAEAGGGSPPSLAIAEHRLNRVYWRVQEAGGEVRGRSLHGTNWPVMAAPPHLTPPSKLGGQPEPAPRAREAGRP